MKVLNAELAGLSDIIFHGTDIDKAFAILKQNKFILAFSKTGSAEDSLNPNPKFHFYLSTARSKLSHYIRTNSPEAIFVLDGRKLGQKYKGGPINYWKGFSEKEQKEKEKEDRVYTKDSYIPNAYTYIKELQVSVDRLNDYRKKYLLGLLKLAKKHNVKVVGFKTFKGMLINSRTERLTEDELFAAVSDVKGKPDSPYSYTKPEDISIFVYAYERMEEAIKKNQDFYKLLASKNYARSKYAKKYKVYDLLQHVFPHNHHDFISTLSMYIGNSRRNMSPELNDAVQSLSRLMRRLKVNDLANLFIKFRDLYSEYNTQSSVRSKQRSLLSAKKVARTKGLLYSEVTLKDDDLIIVHGARIKNRITKKDLLDVAMHLTNSLLNIFWGMKRIEIKLSKPITKSQLSVLEELGFSGDGREYLYISYYSYNRIDLESVNSTELA